MSVDVISWLKSLPKNKPLCQHFSKQLNFHLSVLNSLRFLSVYNSCLWVNYSNTHCKSSISFCCCSLTFLFLVFHNKALRFPVELWLSAAVSVSVQVLPVGPVTAGAVLWSFILYTEVFGRPYYCYLEYVSVQFDDNKRKKKTYNKQMIVMLNLVLIDVIYVLCVSQ